MAGRTARRGWCHDGRVSHEIGHLLVDQLRLMAAHHPDEVGFRVLDGTISSSDRQLTFADWDQMSNQFGRAVQRAGVDRGDRVAIYIAADDVPVSGRAASTVLDQVDQAVSR